MANSIRTRLLLWQAALLLLVVAIFGALLYDRQRRLLLDAVGAELLEAARVLAARPSAEEEELPRWLTGPGSRRPGGPFFAIWSSDDELLRHSPHAPTEPPPAPRPGPKAYEERQRGDLRELVLLARDGSRVLVGKPMHKERHDLWRLASWLTATGFGVVAVGLAGGWLLFRGALRPVEQMSRTAEAISAANLSQRIDAAGAPRELASLALVLNATFARLEAAFERQARFTADASHELRTPLAVIVTQAEMALAHQRSESEYREALEACLRAARRMQELEEALLTLARADAGQLLVQSQSFPLFEVVADCARLVVPQAQERGVNLRLDLAPVTVAGSPERIAQVVTNLLTNAVIHNRPQGTVDVGLREDADAVILEITDTGPGIAPEEHPRLFERFYRTDQARSRDAGGSGLGLAICKELVAAHGGSITVRSVVGQGSTFTVRLPNIGSGANGSESEA